MMFSNQWKGYYLPPRSGGISKLLLCIYGYGPQHDFHNGFQKYTLPHPNFRYHPETIVFRVSFWFWTRWRRSEFETLLRSGVRFFAAEIPCAASRARARVTTPTVILCSTLLFYFVVLLCCSALLFCCVRRCSTLYSVAVLRCCNLYIFVLHARRESNLRRLDAYVLKTCVLPNGLRCMFFM